MGAGEIETLDAFFGWAEAGPGRKRLKCLGCGRSFHLKLMDDVLEAACPSCGRGPFFEHARQIEVRDGPEVVARVLKKLGVLTDREVAAASEAQDPAAPASASDETAGFVGAARALGLFSKSLYLAVVPADGGALHVLRPLRELIDSEQLREAVEVERREGRPAGEVVADLALRGQKELLLTLVDLAPVDLDAASPPRHLVDLVPAGVAASVPAIPIALDGDALVLAVHDPLDFEQIESLEASLGREVRVVPAAEDALFRALERLYPEKELREGEATEPSSEELAAMEEEDFREEEALGGPPGGLPDEPPGLRTVNLLLLQALDERSDHVVIEPLEDAYRVRIRRGGRLRDAARLPQAAGEAAIEHAMVLAGLDISRRNQLQTGTMRLTLAGEPLEVQATTAPAALGPSLALSIREARFRLLSLEGLALVPGDAREIRSVFGLGPGLVLVAAPRGEGKTTLLYALLRETDRVREQVVTLERAIRARVEGATQLAAADYGSLAAAVDALRPDRVFIDDLLTGPGPLASRDEARLALDLALGGARVVATVTARDAVAALSRLIATGIESRVALAAIRALVGLRLVHRVCPRCREDFEASADLADSLGLGEAVAGRRLSIGIGCWECGGTGYSGRSGLAEVIPVEGPVREVLGSLDPVCIRAAAAERGHRPLPEKALFAMRSGLTSASQVEALVRGK